VAQRVRAEIKDLMARRAELSNQLLLQTKSTVVGGNSYAHRIVRFVEVSSLPAWWRVAAGS
jgi:hypothetical protein